MDTNVDATHGCKADDDSDETTNQLPQIKGSGGWGISFKATKHE